jgi:hypothetical protein
MVHEARGQTATKGNRDHPRAVQNYDPEFADVFVKRGARKMATLTEQIEQLRLQIKQVAVDEHALVKEPF